MIHPWIKEYIQLALRVDKAFRQIDDVPFVDYYYGPKDLMPIVEGGPEYSFNNLADVALTLVDSLASQDFESQRANFLERQVHAMEVLCRKLGNQKPFIQEELQRCLDIQPIWKPETEFEQALTLLDDALPGRGDLQNRYHTFLKQMTILPHQSELVLPLMQRILAEARHRTQQFVALPESEELDIHTVIDKSYGAANWYLGNYRSRLELNKGRPVNLFALLYQMCHEGYPGHHTEFVLKEKYLYHARGYTEQSVFFISPQLVVAEGIASLASEIIFTADEIAHWINEVANSELEISIGDVDLPKLIKALAANMLDDLGSNLAIMFRNGHSDKEMMAYALAYTPHTKEQVSNLLKSLRSPLMQIYAFTYFQGKRLLHPLLQGNDRTQVFRRLLTEPVYPSLLAQWVEELDSG